VAGGALPLSQQILLDLIVPPVITIVWGLMPHGWVRAIRRSEGHGSAKQIPWFEFWLILGLCYFVMFGLTIYAWLT